MNICYNNIIYNRMNTIITLIRKLLRRTKKSPAEIKHPAVDEKFLIARDQHHVSKTDISANALAVLNRLNSGGFEAYLVGGSIRDLLLRKAPKDFDVATNATPNQIKKLFRNARIIGRRFKLVHIIYHREIIEVATFRGHDAVDDNHQTNDHGMLIRDNVYGTFSEDAWRRDFTINSLYYTITDNSIVDFTGGFSDINKRLIRMIGDPVKRYEEDPVRMLRAIRFSAKLGFDIEPKTAAPIKPNSGLITHISGSRLFEEMIKLYQSGIAESVQCQLVQFGLFAHLFPQAHELMVSNYPLIPFITVAFQSTDKRIQDNKPVTPAFIFAALLWFPLQKRAAELRDQGIDPLPALDQAMSFVITEQNKIVTIPKRFTQIMREIWLLQYRFSKRTGHRAFAMLTHPRFRGAYDFMALRALAGDESIELADWWTSFQEVSTELQQKMVDKLAEPLLNKPKKRNKPKPKATE